MSGSLPPFPVPVHGVCVKKTLTFTLGYLCCQHRLGPLKMGWIGCPETSVTNYEFTLRKIAEE
jgi:hypothetical protein